MTSENKSRFGPGLGRELTEGLNRLYRYVPPAEPESNPRMQIQINERRGEIADGIQKTRNKLGLSLSDRIGLPVEERPDIAKVIREHLFGFIGDDVLISDIIPTNANLDNRQIKIKTDPLWKHVFPLLTAREIGVVTKALNSLKYYYHQMHNGKVDGQNGTDNLTGKNLNPKTETFETMGDLRKISLRKWSLITGFGPTTASFMFAALEKIEIPAE